MDTMNNMDILINGYDFWRYKSHDINNDSGY